MCTSPKISFGAWEYMCHSQPEQSLGRDFSVFSRIDVRLWLHCWESFSCRKAHQFSPQFRCRPRAALGAVWWQQGGHCAVPSVGCSVSVPQGWAQQLLRLGGIPAAWVKSFGFERQCCRKVCFYVQLLGQIIFKWSHKVFLFFT